MRRALFGFAVASMLFSMTSVAVPIKYQVTNEGVLIQGFAQGNPVIYDNDWWNDVTDGFYLWAKSELGLVNLKGNVVTRDMWDWQKGYLYTMQQGMDSARKAVTLAKHSGLSSVPDPVAGCDQVFKRPASGKIEDTQVVLNPGSELIVSEARKASTDKPLIVFVGGAINTVANATLMDPAIADRLIVCMTDLQGYNGKDHWANYIVAKRCKLINYGAHVWWPQPPQPSVMPLDRFKALPNNPLTREMVRIATMFDQRRNSSPPGRDDGFGDGALIFLYFNPKTWTRVQPQCVKDVFNVQDVQPRNNYDLLDGRDCNYQVMTDDFFLTFKTLTAKTK